MHIKIFLTFLSFCSHITHNSSILCHLIILHQLQKLRTMNGNCQLPTIAYFEMWRHDGSDKITAFETVTPCRLVENYQQSKVTFTSIFKAKVYSSVTSWTAIKKKGKLSSLLKIISSHFFKVSGPSRKV
jgi:hypothetical protein